MLRVISDILDALNRGDLAALTLLDLSATLDTVYHKTLIRSASGPSLTPDRLFSLCLFVCLFFRQISS